MICSSYKCTYHKSMRLLALQLPRDQPGAVDARPVPSPTCTSLRMDDILHSGSIQNPNGFCGHVPMVAKSLRARWRQELRLLVNTILCWNGQGTSKQSALSAKNDFSA